jgi:DNA-binding transcriptional regulator YiaG
MSNPKTGKRKIFSELMEGLNVMKDHREGKVTLRTHKLPDTEIEESPGAEFFVAVRKEFNVSRAVWANMLRVSPRTVEKWEQGGQVSPLATTFVELVSYYPDTIERLQALPKYVRRAEGKLKSHRRAKTVLIPDFTSMLEKQRARYRPNRIKVLFVGEAPPAGGTFFYAGNSQLHRYLSEALQMHLKYPQNFLQSFKDNGYFLDDLVLEPLDKIPIGKRTPIFRRNVPLLAKRIAEYAPAVVVTVLKRIRPYVEDAISKTNPNIKHYCVSFPGNGQQANFRREMAEIVPSLP